jgi:predicted Zn-dependent protease
MNDSPRRCRRISRLWFVVPCLFIALSVSSFFSPARAQEPPATAEEESQQKQIVERFQKVLERNPRRGTALDKIYGFHIENGTLETFVKQLEERVAAEPVDGVGWMILGLVESQRGRDAAAAVALAKASELRTDDPLAAYYLGQSLVLTGQPDKAAAAFEQAITRKPAQADLLEIFQSLGRVHQRAQRNHEALAVWSRLEKLFPGDQRVQEQIAATLVEEGQSAEALPRYEALVKATKDDYRRAVYRMEAAELKVKLSRRAEAIADLEQLLAGLNPESWLFRDVRRKIEDVFLRSDDQDGLATYYSKWIDGHADDVEAMTRLARVLSRQSRSPEAREWLTKALQLAPSRRDLRMALIDQLVDDQKFAEAAVRYAELDKLEPNNPDVLRDWGKVVLRDGTRNTDERRAEAQRIWSRLVAARPTDPLVSTQVADLLRHAEMHPQALALYQKAVELAPAAPQYREYLGEYYHSLKRSDEALATWRKMAAGDLRTAMNLARLAEVLAQFGYLPQALPEIAVACELDPRDLGLQLKAADLLQRSEQYDAALAALTRAEQIAQNSDEREVVLNQQMKCLEGQGSLDERATELAKKAAGNAATQRDWFLLARYREALHEYPEATRAIAKALELAPADVPSLAAAARIAEQSGDLGSAAVQNRKLATVDRRSRSTYLERVAGLEAQLGRTDAALAAGKELIAAAPGNAETYQLFADLCFRLGRTEEGLAALRRATRTNPNDPSLLMSLAGALANQFRPEEAIEIYWQAYEKERDLDDKLTVVGRLTDLYLQTNHFDRLLERLQRGRGEADQRREMTIALAQAHQSAGDYGMARHELESLLGDSTRDTTLLLQLSKLAESESDFADAVKYQQQVVRLAPGNETEYRLAALLARAGDHGESAALMARLAAKETDRNKLLRNIDGLLSSSQQDAALGILEARLRETPADWELLYRRGVLLAERDVMQAALDFQALLNQAVSDEEPAAAAKGQQQRGSTAPPMISAAATSNYTGTLYRLTYQSQVRNAVGLDGDRVLYSTTNRGIWMPLTHGQARMAAIGWLYRFASDQKQGDKFVAERRQKIESPTASVRELWDWLYLQTLRLEPEDSQTAAHRLAELGDLAGQAQFLQLTLRSTPIASFEVAQGQAPRTSEPLSPADLELALKSFQGVQRSGGDLAASLSVALIGQLRRSSRSAEADSMYRELVSHADSPRQIIAAMQIAAESEDFEQTLVLLDRFAKRDLQSTESKAAVRAERTLLASAINRLAAAKQRSSSELLKLLDHFLDFEIAVASQQLDNPLARLQAASGPTRTTLGVPIFSTGGTVRRVAFNYPLPSAYYDHNTLQVLRSFYEQFKERDLVSDLRKHLEQRAAAAAGDKVFWLLAVAYHQVWDEDVEKAFATLASALELAPNDADLRLDTARLYSEHQKFDDALTLIDTIAPRDQKILQQRETMALDLAARLGEKERACEAAQRLFGLQLDVTAQTHLAGQMRRLGMDAEASAVLARSQRQAGSRPSALAALMQQYDEQGQTEQAVLVAQRIIRATRNTPSAAAGLPISQPITATSAADAQYRTAAIQVLSKAGKLKEAIAALEDQIARMPMATQLYESLAEYYRLDGNPQKANALTAKLVELKPEDASLRYRYAQELYRQRKYAEACDQYKVVLQKQPQLIAQRYFEVTQAFQQAQKQAELAEVLGQIDLKSLGQPYMVTNMLSTMMRTPQSRTAGLVLFKKAWEAFPAERLRLIGYVSEDLWQLPEVLEYAKQTLRPSADLVRRDPWYGLQAGGVGFSSNGVISSGMSRLLLAATKANLVAELRSEIATAAAEQPNWQAGPVLLALIDLKQRKEVDVPAIAKPLLDAKTNTSSLMYTRCVFAQELESHPEHRELAAHLYSLAVLSGTTSWPQFQFSPANSVVRLYKQLGRNDEAVAFLRKMIRGETSSASNYTLPASMRAESMSAIAKYFEQLDAPADALQIYRDILNDNLGRVSSSAIVVSPTSNSYKQEAQRGLQSMLTRIAKRPGDVIALLTPTEKRSAGTPAIDLFMDVGGGAPGPLHLIDSPMTKAIRADKLTADTRPVVESHLASLAEKYPRDFSVAIIRALFTLDEAAAQKTSAGLDQLLALVDQTPLEEISAGQRPNSRQRAEAAQQVALWLVARECLPQTTLRETGEKLSERALAAARRQTDNNQLASILYESGRLSLNAGDKPAAERRWNELIEVAVVQQRQQRASSPPAATSTRTRATTRPAGSLAPTTSQFVTAATIAQTAAEHDMVEISLRAIGEALAGGPPVTDAQFPPATLSGRGMTITAPPSLGATPFGTTRPAFAERPAQELTSRLWQLSVVWKQHNFPPAQVFQVLAALVFPAGRPDEIVLPDQPTGADLLTSRSMGGILVDWASRADHGAELKRQVAARQASATDVARGHLLLVELSILEQDPTAAGPHLTALAAQLGKGKLSTLERRVAQATPGSPAPMPQPVAAQQPAKADPPKTNGAPQTVPQAADAAQQSGKSLPAANYLETWWNDLEKTEAVAARALLRMADRPKETVAFLKQHLKPLKITAERVQTLLVNLGSAKEVTWKAAYEELEYFDPRLAIDLQSLMDDVTTSPARQRMVEILSQRPMNSLAEKDVSIRRLGSGSDGYNFFDGRGSWWAEHRVERINIGSNPKRKWTQAVRAIILLEHIGTPEATAILRDMATGHEEAQPTKVAAEALERLIAKGK